MSQASSSTPKTGVCRLYAQGSCRFGARCRFAHLGTAPPELGTNKATASKHAQSSSSSGKDVLSTSTPQKSNSTKNEICKFLKNGSCKFGSRCRFSHDLLSSTSLKDGGSKTGTPGNAQIDNPVPSRRKPCFKWNATGACKKGDTCEYYHDPGILEALRQEQERRIQEERRVRAEAEERRRAEEERQREGQRRLEELRRQKEEQRREQERARREVEAQRRAEEQRARREAELIVKRQEQHRVESARKITREVDGCIVTFSAGLAVNTVTASFDVTRGRIHNLPSTIQAKDIIAFFEQHGIDSRTFAVGKAYKSDSAFVGISTSTVPRLAQLPSLHNVTLRFVPFKNNLADDKLETNAFSRTLSVQITQNDWSPSSVLDAFQEHLELHARGRGLRSVRRESSRTGQVTRVTFHVELDTWGNAERLRNTLHAQGSFRYSGLTFTYTRLFLPSKYSYPIFVSATQYHVQKTQWEELTQTCKRDSCDLRVRHLPDGKVRLNLHGDELTKVGPLKIRAEQLARGTTFNMWNRRLFDPATAQKLTDDLREATSALVEVDRRIKGLRAYGPARAVEQAREQLQFYAEELARNEYVKELTTQRTVRFFVEIGYPQLKETYGDDAVTLDLVSQPKKITVTGDEEIRHRLDRLFTESFGNWSSTATKGTTDTGHPCPICMSPAMAPSVLGCGHVYCTECLTHFVRSALESSAFPLRCSGDESRCAEPLVISVLEKFLHAGKFQQLLETAFHAYMEQNPDALRPCNTPGCTQIYTKSAADDGSATVKCPGCFTSACAACGNNAHSGMSCERAARDPSEDYINDRASGIKRCPRCRTPIYKDGGCQHVSCKCGAHICWRCLATFDASGACYTHMGTAHGGIYEEEMVPAGRDEHVEPAIPAEFLEEDRQARMLARAAEAVRANDLYAGFNQRQDILARRRVEQAAWQADYDRRYGDVLRAQREADEERCRRERAEAQQQRGGWCVIM